MQKIKNIIDETLYGTMFSIQSLYYDWYKKGIVLTIQKVDKICYYSCLITKDTTNKELIEWLEKKVNS